MYKLNLDEDIQSLSEFRSKVAFYFDKVKKTKRPLIITQNGKSSAVLLDVVQYQALLDKLDLLEDIKVAEEQLAAGKGIKHQDFKKKFLKSIKK